MHLSCIICNDIFNPSDVAYTTKCGHIFHYSCLIQWLERSKSCPQCRYKVTEQSMYRLYFNIANLDVSGNNVGVLVNELDNLRFRKTSLEKDVKDLKESNDTLKNQNSGLRKEVADLENQIRSLHSTLLAVKEQMSYFKTKAKESNQLSEEIVKLRNRIKTMENVQIVMDATKDEVNHLLKSEHDLESLAVYAAMLKKSLVESDQKRNNAEHNFRQAKATCSKYKKFCHELKHKHTDLEQKYEYLTRRKHLNQQIKSDRIVSSGNQANITNTSLKRVSSETPTYLNKIPKLTKPEEGKVVPKVHDLNTTYTKIPAEEAAVSPYLQVKPGSLDYSSFAKMKLTSIRNGNSIFKNSTSISSGVIVKTMPADVGYNGLGGTSKVDVFPTGKAQATGLKRHKPSACIPTNKFKKLAPVSSKAITDYLQQ